LNVVFNLAAFSSKRMTTIDGILSDWLRGRTGLLLRCGMDRRQVLKAVVACSVGGWVVRPALAGFQAKALCHKQLDAAATSLKFERHELAAGGALLLRPSGNALWINTARWQDAHAHWHHIDIRRNIAPDTCFPLHFGSDIRHLEFSITTLPFTNSSTRVSLLA
jgi:hypothetical protein